jgi:nucleoside-diphosphate-sugar epimerase
VIGDSLLVVGSAGFVESNLVRAVLDDGAARVVVVDTFLSSEPETVTADDRLEVREGTIADRGVLATIEDEFDYVFHLATYHGNQSSIADPLADHDNNLVTTLKLYERIKAFERLKKVVYSASGCTLAPHEVYDGATATNEDGAAPFDLDSPYQISKVVGEFYAVYYHHQHGLPTVRARFQNVYGPGEILGAGRWRGTPATVWRNVTPAFVYRALKGMPLQLENEGLASRDFIYVGDIVEGLLRCATKGEPGDVYNLAAGVETSIRELAETINRIAGNEAGVELLPARDWDRSGRRFGSPEKARRELGFEANVDLDDGLRRTVEWTRANIDRIDACVARHSDRLATA